MKNELIDRGRRKELSRLKEEREWARWRADKKAMDEAVADQSL